MDPHPDRERLGALTPGALRGLLDRHRGVRRPPRRILDRLEAERRHDPRRAQLLDAPAEALHLLHEDLERPAGVQAGSPLAGGAARAARSSVSRRRSHRTPVGRNRSPGAWRDARAGGSGAAAAAPASGPGRLVGGRSVPGGRKPCFWIR